MRHLVPLFLLAGLGASTAEPERPTFHVAEGSSVTKTFEEKLELKLESLHAWAGDEEIPADNLGDFSLDIESTERRVLTDLYVKVGDGRPVELERTFDELGAHSVERTRSEDHDAEQERDRESELEGQTVVFRFDEASEEYAVAFKGDEGDQALLDGLEEDTDLRAFLPTKSVAQGDTWDVDAKASNALTFPGGDLKLVATEEEDDPIDRMQLRDNVEGKIVATYAGRREVGGLAFDVIELALELRTHADGEREGGAGKRHFEFAHELKGELLWSVELGRAHSLLVEGRTKVGLTHEATFETDDGELTFKQEFAFAGTARFEATFADAQ